MVCSVQYNKSKSTNCKKKTGSQTFHDVLTINSVWHKGYLKKKISMFPSVVILVSTPNFCIPFTFEKFIIFISAFKTNEWIRFSYWLWISSFVSCRSNTWRFHNHIINDSCKRNLLFKNLQLKYGENGNIFKDVLSKFYLYYLIISFFLILK